MVFILVYFFFVFIKWLKKKKDIKNLEKIILYEKEGESIVMK